MRALIADCLAVVLLSIYGTEVCPYMDGLGHAAVALNVGGAFLVSLGVGTWIERRFVDHSSPVARSSDERV